MTELDPLKMGIALLGGLALFLYGMEKMTGAVCRRFGCIWRNLKPSACSAAGRGCRRDASGSTDSAIEALADVRAL